MPLPEGLDMNVESNRILYRDLALFKNDFSQNDKLWHGTNSVFRTILHAFADDLDLEYEYSSLTAVARICHRDILSSWIQEQPVVPDTDFSQFLDLNQSLGMDVDERAKTSNLNPNTNLLPQDVFTSDSSHIPSFTTNTDYLNSSLMDVTSPQGRRLEFLNTNNIARCTSFSEDTLISTHDKNLTDTDHQQVIDTYPADIQKVLNCSNLRHIVAEHRGRGTSGQKKIHLSTLPSFRSDIFKTNRPFWKRSRKSLLVVHASSNASSYGSSISSGSIHSARSGNGQLNFMTSTRRRHSTADNSDAGYDEIVFDSCADSGSNISGSQVSARLGRRGPMNTASRIAQNAVKTIKACWKCKFTRRGCDTNTPCKVCTRTSVRFDYFGCRRGPLEQNMNPLKFCPVRNPENKGKNAISEMLLMDIRNANQEFSRLCDERSVELMHVGETAPESYENRDTWPELVSPRDQPFPVSCFRGSRYSTLESNYPAALIPLNECILDIIWGFNSVSLASDSSGVRRVVGLNGVTSLLCDAAFYQSETNHDQLVAQSLICLRSCLEAVLLDRRIKLSTFSHSYCLPQMCASICTQRLHGDIDGYVNELSRVFFQCDMRNKKAWWLSIFYSLIIQACVREFLKNLESYSSGVVFEYLHLPVQLFITNSVNYDPIAREMSDENENYIRLRAHFNNPQGEVLVGGTFGSHLKALFEIDTESNQGMNNS